jgi:uncharacterized small protein (TIGR04563 family)
MSGSYAYALNSHALHMQDTFSADFQRLTFANAAPSLSTPAVGAAAGSVAALPIPSRVSAGGESVLTTAQTSTARTTTSNEQQTRGLMSDNARGSDKRKQSLYFPEAMLQEIKDEAARLDRSLSWIVQRAWKTARADIRKIPSVNEIDDDSMGGDEP